jgi:arylsulfatase
MAPLQYTRRSFFEWASVFLAIALSHCLWMVQSWLLNFTVRQWIGEIGIEIAVALAAAAIFAFLATLFWFVAGRISDRAARIAQITMTIAAAMALVLVVLVTNLKWLSQTMPVSLAIRGGIAFAVLSLLGWQIARALRRDPELEGISTSTQLLARRTFLATVPVALAAPTIAGMSWRPYHRSAGAAPDNAAARPNILLVTFDTLAASDMSLYGHKLATTPNIDRFARDGLIFENAIAASNFTSSAIPSMLTGVTVVSHGRFSDQVGHVTQVLRQQNLATELKRHGYVTGALVTNSLGHPTHLGLDAGFDYLPPPPLRRFPLTDSLYHVSHSDIGATFFTATDTRIRSMLENYGIKREEGTIFPPRMAFNEALTFIHAARRPWFLWIHTYAPHTPYLPPAPFLGRFLQTQEYVRSSDYLNGKVPGPNTGAYAASAQGEIDKLRLRYNEFMAYSDDAFGKFLRAFEAMPGAANTISMISTDHGEGFNHGLWGHADKHLWQPSIHIPMILKYPGMRRTGRIQNTVGHIDMVPTLLDLAGLPAPSWTEGSSMRAIWEGQETAPRPRLSEYLHPPGQGAFTGGGVAHIYDGEKFILDLATGQCRLYDLRSDPGENYDLSASRPDRVRELKTMTLARLQAAPRR